MALSATVVACDKEEDEAPVETAPSASVAEEPPPAPAEYEVQFGPSSSKTDPALKDVTDEIPTGFVSLRLKTDRDAFQVPEVEITLFQATDGGSPKVMSKKTTPLGGQRNVLYKSWKITEPAEYIVEVRKPGEDILATGRFHVVEAPDAGKD